LGDLKYVLRGGKRVYTKDLIEIQIKDFFLKLIFFKTIFFWQFNEQACKTPAYLLVLPIF